MNKLASTRLGAAVDVLGISTLSLVYYTAEYSDLVWESSTHSSLVHTQLNKAMRFVSGTIKSTNVEWLPVLTNTKSTLIRRAGATLRQFNKKLKKPDLPIHKYQLVYNRLNSRKRGSGLPQIWSVGRRCGERYRTGRERTFTRYITSLDFPFKKLDVVPVIRRELNVGVVFFR